MDSEHKAAVIIADKVVTGGLIGMARDLLGAFGIVSSEQKMRDGQVEMYQDFVHELQDEVRNLRQHREIPPPKINQAQTAAILATGLEVFKTVTDDKKQRLLKNALINAFDPQLYEQGLTRRLLNIMKDLEYGDISLLADTSLLGWRLETNENSVTAPKHFVPNLEILEHHHLQILLNHGLASLKRSGNHEARVLVTALGKHMLTMLREPSTGQ